MKTRSVIILALAILPVFAGCSKGRKESPANATRAEKPIAPVSAAEVKSEPSSSQFPPPSLHDAESAVRRIFGGNVAISADSKMPFIVGDFNGDQTEDLAVVVRPVPGKLGELNGELANWIIQDADQAFLPPAGKAVVIMPKAERPQVVEGENLLAVIHGYGPAGWRNADAQQAYLVRHAGAALLGTVPSSSSKALHAMKLPVKADIIQADRNRQKGFIFWTGAAYAWHTGN